MREIASLPSLIERLKSNRNQRVLLREVAIEFLLDDILLLLMDLRTK